MKTNRFPILSIVLLAACLLIAQLGAVAHGLEHSFEHLGVQASEQVQATLVANEANEGTLQEHDGHDEAASCLACLSYASIGIGARSEAQIALATPPSSKGVWWHLSATVTSLTPQQHRARAPPVFS